MSKKEQYIEAMTEYFGTTKADAEREYNALIERGEPELIEFVISFAINFKKTMKLMFGGV